MSIGLNTLIIIAVAWELFWDGCALWVAARRGEKTWFVVLLIVHLLGLLSIYYLYTRKMIKLPAKKAKKSK